ncbi:MAG: triose-phosphate isomerase [Gammaproteobacteria bacterium]|nr:triose-phosphate isomerase [Gammaproteobacteria bacterium]
MSGIKRRPLIVGNWKMNGRRSDVIDLAQACHDQSSDIDHCDIAVCPPPVYLSDVGQTLTGSAVALGAQDVSQFADDGAHTGEVSAAMLADIGCRYVIIGHSERRQQLHETDALVAEKVQHVMHSDKALTPIICVGEDSEARENGQSWSIVQAQLSSFLPIVSKHPEREFVVAYEPIWAIGSGQAATPDDIQSMLGQIRQHFSQAFTDHFTEDFTENRATKDAKLPGPATTQLRLLYGGSLKPANAQAILSLPDVDGGLIGGAALDASAFAAIAQANV